MASELWGKLIGDRGYLSQPLFEKLYQQGLQLITPIRKNMRNRLNLAQVKLLLHRRTVIETIIDQLKNISQVVHSHYLTPINFLVNLIAGLFTNTWQSKRPSVHLSEKEATLLPALI